MRPVPRRAGAAQVLLLASVAGRHAARMPMLLRSPSPAAVTSPPQPTVATEKVCVLVSDLA